MFNRHWGEESRQILVFFQVRIKNSDEIPDITTGSDAENSDDDGAADNLDEGDRPFTFRIRIR